VTDPDMGIPRTLKHIDENSNSLKKLKYREQFLQALKEYNEETPTQNLTVKKKQ
jgi:hypothetical protein